MHNVLTFLSLSLSLVASSTAELTTSFRGAERLTTLHRSNIAERQITSTTPSFVFQISQNATTCQPFDIRWTFSGFTDTNASVNLVVTKLSNATGLNAGTTSPQTVAAAAASTAQAGVGGGTIVSTGNAPRATTQNGKRGTSLLRARHLAAGTSDDAVLVARQTTTQQQVPVIVEQLTTATPLLQQDFLIQALNLPPGITYTLSATIASTQGVLVFQSIPFFVAAGPDQSCVINQATATVTTNAPSTASAGDGAIPVATVSANGTGGTATAASATSTAAPKASNKPVIIAAILGGLFFLFVLGVAIYTIRKSRMSRQNDEYEARQAFNDSNRF